MRVILITIGLLTLSNICMTFAWYAHLRNLNDMMDAVSFVVPN
jgi:uncharacterized protein (DUF486 family)